MQFVDVFDFEIAQQFGLACKKQASGDFLACALFFKAERVDELTYIVPVEIVVPDPGSIAA